MAWESHLIVAMMIHLAYPDGNDFADISVKRYVNEAACVKGIDAFMSKHPVVQLPAHNYKSHDVIEIVADKEILLGILHVPSDTLYVMPTVSLKASIKCSRYTTYVPTPDNKNQIDPLYQIPVEPTANK